jgi:hypothetical protein
MGNMKRIGILAKQKNKDNKAYRKQIFFSTGWLN